MSELRWHPLLDEWVVTATHRQERPNLPKDVCPFCPGSKLVPDSYDMYIYPNDFPTFQTPPPVSSIRPTELYRVEPAVGVSDVVLYTSDHNRQLAELDVAHIRRLVNLWVNRYRELGRREEIKYIFIFENKGDVIGVTIRHPHGQIYGFPFIPPKVQDELEAARRHFESHERCLLCDILREEQRDGRRIIDENASFVAFVPFFARFPYEVHVLPRRHFGSFFDIAPKEMGDLAIILKTVTMKYDGLFGFSFPYMMVMHQSPTNTSEYPYYHYHIEFYPPHRGKDKIKYLAGCESGGGTFINDTAAEEKAAELRNVSVRF